MILGPIQFYMFINDLDEGTEPRQQTFILYKTAENTSAIQRDLKSLEKCADGNLMKFSNTKCRVLHQGNSHPEPQLMLGERIASQSRTHRQTASWAWANSKPLQERQPRDPRLHGEGLPAHEGRWSFHSAQHSPVLCPVLGFPVQGRHGHAGTKSSEGSQRPLRGYKSVPQGKAEWAGTAYTQEEKAWRGIPSMINTWWEAETELGSSQVWSERIRQWTKTETHQHKLLSVLFNFFFTMKTIQQWIRYPKKLGSLHP